MFVVRQANVDDAPTLLKLAKMVHSNNLPADPEYLRDKLRSSRLSFAGKVEDPTEREFIFVLEDTDSANVVGTSSIIAAMGRPGRPHLYFKVHKREMYSEDLQTGQVHITLQLKADESGPSEIGGLVLSPGYRHHRAKLGSMLSMVRFHFIGLYRQWFGARIIAEMMGPLTPDSRNSLWEALGRRFINLAYDEADRFSRQSKEFITSLFPEGEIYTSLLPPEARNLIGKVGKEAEPARTMLERIGFQYAGAVDPFDGGPYLVTAIEDIELVRTTRSTTLGDPVDVFPLEGYVSVTGSSGFRAVRCRLADDGELVSIPAEAAGLLRAQVGDTVGVTPIGAAPASEVDPSAATSRSGS